jgi:hypothetical protein
MIALLHDTLFGRWQDQAVNIELELPDGLHFMRARTFGLKGRLGGQHSYVAYVRNGVHTVFEVSSAETLDYQEVSFRSYIRRPVAPLEQVVLASDRHAGQRWFGHKPRLLATVRDAALLDVLDVVNDYPKVTTGFHLFANNCNTFVSWVAYNFNVKLPWTPGSKRHSYWKKHAIQQG